MKLNEAIAKVKAQLPMNDVTVQRSVAKAEGIVQQYGYSIAHKGNGLYSVSRASTSLFEDNSAKYSVTKSYCTCMHYEKARANLCKHRIAIMIMEEMRHALSANATIL